MLDELAITTEGRVTLRPEVLAHLGVAPGDKLDVALLPGGRVELRPAAARPVGTQAKPISRLRGILHRPGQRRVSLEEMQDAIEQSAVARFNRCA